MTSDKKNISLLADIFVKSGLSDIVISPGSRNAPIIISFANRKEIEAFSIVDERSAAFFALGLALKTQKTVAIACTSGSAVLNYSSAISEAYYQKVPLLVLTADRPKHLIDVGDGQTIRQKGVFTNFIKKSYELPEDINTEVDFAYAENIINKALNNCQFPEPGPVHINIPFNDPLYKTTEDATEGNVIKYENTLPVISNSKLSEITEKINSSQKVMLIAGQMQPNSELNSILQKISKNNNVIVLTETTSNLYSEDFVDTIDNVISTIKEGETELCKPDILISFGGQVVSKMIKKFLRANKPETHWHISPSGEKTDTYFSLDEVIEMEELDFFKSISNKIVQTGSDYSALWLKLKRETGKKKAEYLDNSDYSDLKVFKTIITHIPENSILHLGNSTPVRYSQLFGSKKDIVYNSNRGVSGIDGQVSTAVGYSYYSKQLNVLITGDLGFLYDSNGLMNKYSMPNLKIIVINNSGGGIFRFIPGPDTTPNLEEFFEAKHNWKAEHICKAFGVDYVKAENLDDLENILPEFLKVQKQNTEVLEIFTPPEKSAEVLRKYFGFIGK